ncbi:hypothetical protein [Ancylobacter mangrovi]|uniref:hypothetical protein n=1 Tax=Ancylobacter mangrovi TaxID=2972472 RepID=UPI0021619782|nr:hypothetical protein [Ancylobacter mangrovi]MCS0501372.1 hypothetical protein [Ancylobacter mangrovi]
MSRRFVLGNVAGGVRLRTARPGYDAGDPALDPRFLSFDSQWPNGFRLIGSGVAAVNSLPGGGWTPIPNATTVYRDIPAAGSGPDRVALAWGTYGAGSFPYVAPGSTSITPFNYARRYDQMNVILGDNYIRVPVEDMSSPTHGLYDGVTYFLFKVLASGVDPTPAAGNNAIFGNHPSRGPGLFIARRGADVRTCGDDDLILSTQKNHFQVAEIGQVATQYRDGFSKKDAFVTLSRSYPNYPPVVAFAAEPVSYSDGTFQQQLISAYWVSPNQLYFHTLFSTEHGHNIRFAVAASDPAYQGGVDAGSTLRCLAAPSIGFGVTKHNVHADAAGEWDWIFRADRMSLQFRGFGEVTTGRDTGIYTLPVASTSGLALVFYVMNQPGVGYIVGCGASSVNMFYDPSYAYKKWWAICTAAPNQYYWRRDGDAGLHVGGFAAVCNVADF